MSADTPFVSVVMPLYNQAAYVAQAVASVLEQDWPALELIVVDDGSTDDGPAIVTALADRAGGRLRLIHQANSGGPAQPRNRAILEAAGDIVAFLDPDDFWYPGKLSIQVRAMQTEPDAVMSFTEAHTVDADGHVLGSYLGRVGYLQRAGAHLKATELPGIYRSGSRFLAYSSVDVAGPQTSGVVVRRDALRAQHRCFETDFWVGEDLDLWFRLMAAGPCMFIDQPLHAYRQHGASLMRQSARTLSGSARCHARNFERVACQLTASERRMLAKRIGSLHGSAGWNLARQGLPASARREYLQALRWHFNIAHVRGLLRNWMPNWLVQTMTRGQ